MLVLSSQSRLLGTNPVVWLCDQEPVKTFQTPMILAAVFSPNSKSRQKGVFSREMTYFFGFYGPKIGGGVLLPEFCPKISKTLKFGLFWGIFACSGLVLQNSAAHQCTCL